MYDPGSKAGETEGSGGFAINGVIASTDHLPADMANQDSPSRKTTVMPCVYSSYIREPFEEN